jgi:hypothetical protein
VTTPVPAGGADELAHGLGQRIVGSSALMAMREWWVSDGVPGWAVPTSGSTTRLALLGGRTVWPRRPPAGTLVVACPNRLGMIESVPPWAPDVEIVWVTDALDWRRSPWQHLSHARVLIEPYVEMEAAGMTLDEAAQRSGDVVDALARHLLSAPGCTVPSGGHGRRLPALVEVEPAAVARRVAEASVPEPPVPGWPGCVVFDGDWRWPSTRPREVAEVIEVLVRAERARDRHRMSEVDQEPP